MRIVTSYQPGDIAEGIKKITVHSNRILLSAIYLSGLIFGCILYITAEPLRSFADRVLQGTLVEQTPLSELSILLAVMALGAGTVLFGAGLSLVGYPCIYLTPFCLGFATGLFFISFFGTDTPMGLIRILLLQPVCGASICAVLSMCGYAADMSGSLIRSRNGREAQDAQKYALRILLLTVSAMVFALILSCIMVLLRHIR